MNRVDFLCYRGSFLVIAQFFCALVLHAQSDLVEISQLKTTTLVFSSPIETVDRGSADVLVQQVTNLDNVLQIKARSTDFPETNLTVFTSDGHLHGFTVRYSASPDELQFRILESGRMEKIGHQHCSLFRKKKSLSQIRDDAQRIADQSRPGHVAIRKDHRLKLVIRGIYASADLLYMHLHIVNLSNASLTPASPRFFIHDKRKLKRRAQQQIALRPQLDWSREKTIAPMSSSDRVVVFSRFTVADEKRLRIELAENEGGRKIGLEIPDRHLLKALPLPD